MAAFAVRPYLALAAVLAIVLVSPAQARDGWFGADKPGARALYYGEVPAPGEQPNAETIYLSLACADKGNAIEVWVSESSNKLIPGRKLRVVLSAAGVSSAAMGKTVANELAGIPSIRASYPPAAAVFAAMTETASLRISTGGWRSSTPAKGLGKRLKTLLAACGK